MIERYSWLSVTPARRVAWALNGVGYWPALALAVLLVGVFGAALDATILRRLIGQPQFAVVMLTIGLIELFSGAYLPHGFKDVAAYVVLLIVLAVRPQGIFGTIARKKV